MTSLLRPAAFELEIVDLSALRPSYVDPLFEEERRCWQERLFWNVAPSLAVVRRALEQRTLAGKAVCQDGRVLGYGYYLSEGQRALVAGLAVAKDADGFVVGGRLLDALLHSAQREIGVRRVESQFVSFGLRWLRAPFSRASFHEHRRLFLRRALRCRRGALLGRAGTASSRFELDSWRAEELPHAAVILERAHAGKIDGTINELYRTREGCRLLLSNITLQRGCGPTIPGASFLARDRDSGEFSGLLIATEISGGHAHLAQIAVVPEAQGGGLGRLLLGESLAALTREGFYTVSLMVSQENSRALLLYESFGFQTVVEFPVFTWDRR